MASQPTFVPYTPLPIAAPRPNIRIAYIAGDASVAIHRGMASFPPAVRESTLEELAIAGLTDELIAAGRDLLSPLMYAAFLRWGETASHFSSYYVTDGEGLERSSANSVSVAAITALIAANAHDAALKMHLLNIEAGDCPDFGPVNSENADGSKLPPLIDSVNNDLCVISPIVALLDDLAKLAWSASGIPASSFTVEIGAVITSAFRSASEAMGLDIAAPASLPAIIDGYSPFMRGPLIAWRKAYAVFLETDTELRKFEHTTFKSTLAAFNAIRGDATTPATPEVSAALQVVPMDAVQERFDDLVFARHEASERLLRTLAPSAAELAVKLRIFHQDEGWTLEYAPEVVERLMTDARRFAKHGAFIQADGSILAAYAGCRHEMIGAYGSDAMTREEEDAYFTRLDAYEATLLDASASTIEGVIAKLRVAFSRINPNAWSDHAVMDPASGDFREGLRMDGMFERMAWGAIEDLALIGGINLAEQGA